MGTARLQKFTQFAQKLLPHELGYLQAVAQFQDEDKNAILERLVHNSQPEASFIPFDLSIDRRKYSYMMNWIEQKLDTISVDKQYEWISTMERNIMTDAITPEEEQDLLKAIREYDKPLFYFVKFYEMAHNYRHYLLIRMRYREHEEVDKFLRRMRYTYDRSLYINERLHKATLDITAQYATNEKESAQWEDFLLSTFYDDNLDGQNRDLAAHRLAFLYVNYQQPEKLRQVYDYLDQMLHAGLYYSRRILAKYYANRLILHAKLREWKVAEQYGHLSVRYHGSEYLQHLTNLSAVMLRQGKEVEALNLMQQALPEVRKSQSYHDKTGFAAFYIKSLFRNRQYKKAKQYAESFLRSHESEALFLQRWHIFFTAYFQVLTQQEQFQEIRALTRKYDLEAREQRYRLGNAYLPHLNWYIKLAAYKEGKLGERTLHDLLKNDLNQYATQKEERFKMRELLAEFERQVPVLMQQVKDVTKRSTTPAGAPEPDKSAKSEGYTPKT